MRRVRPVLSGSVVGLLSLVNCTEGNVSIDRYPKFTVLGFVWNTQGLPVPGTDVIVVAHVGSCADSIPSSVATDRTDTNGRFDVWLQHGFPRYTGCVAVEARPPALTKLPVLRRAQDVDLWIEGDTAVVRLDVDYRMP